MRTREEHIAECKRRARDHLNTGDIAEAITSMLSDLGKHPETRGIGEKMAMLGIFYIIQHDERGARDFIEGFR
jgi:hypothetical protein